MVGIAVVFRLIYFWGSVDSSGASFLNKSHDKSRFLDGWGVLTSNHPANQKCEMRAGNKRRAVIVPSYPGQKRYKHELTM